MMLASALRKRRGAAEGFGLMFMDGYRLEFGVGSRTYTYIHMYIYIYDMYVCIYIYG